MNLKYKIRTAVSILFGLLLISIIGSCSRSPAPILDRSGDKNLALLLEKIRVKTGQPALACAVIVDGKLKAAAAVGTRKKGTENWVSIDDRFIIGSCGKAFTAVLGAIMVEEG